MAHLLDLVEELPQTTVSIDLAAQTVTLPDVSGAENSWTFDIDPFRKQCMLRGLDDLGYLLDKEEQIQRIRGRGVILTPVRSWLPIAERHEPVQMTEDREPGRG